MYNILYGNTFLLVLLFINVHAYTFQVVYTRHYMCTCRPDRKALRNVHLDLRVFNTVRKNISNQVQQIIPTYISLSNSD